MPSELYVCWISFGFAIGFALWYFMALNGIISALARKENNWKLTPAEALSAGSDEGNTRLPRYLMIGSIFLAILALTTVGFTSA